MQTINNFMCQLIRFAILAPLALSLLGYIAIGVIATLTGGTG